MAFAALNLAACGQPSSPSSSATAPTQPSLIPVPLATSVDAAGGTWATLPMGHLDDPLNTFWQLFYRPAGGTAWSDRVEATATATNGGLVLAPASGRSLLVGIRPSNLLHFSPLIQTEDGRTWSNGLTGALVARPDALAVATDGQSLALVAAGGTTQVLTSRGDLSSWPELTALPALAAAPAARPCAPASLGAVGFAGPTPVVGAACTRPGVVGLFTDSSGSWQQADVPLPSSLADGMVEVLGLQSANGALSALLAVVSKTGTAIVAAGSADNGSTWAVSAALPLQPGETLSSFGTAAGDGVFVLVSGAQGSERLEVLDGPGSSWQELPPPPPGTATVAFGPSTSVQALVANQAVLTVWTLEAPSGPWTRGQVVDVPIQYGSSS